jgi:hypothetical protein
MIIEVNLDEFLYKYFRLFNEYNSISIYDINMIILYTEKLNKNNDIIIYFNFSKEDYTCIHTDFNFSISEKCMYKIHELSLQIYTIDNYIRIPDVVIDAMKLYERTKKIKKIIKKVNVN